MSEKRDRTSLVFAKEYPPKITWYHSALVYDDLKMLLEVANNKLLKKDLDLFKYDVSERTICAAFMLHLKSVLWGTPFRTYHIDVEYNRNIDGLIKTIIDDNEVVTNITCDLVVHSRGDSIEQDNLISLEMKKSDRENDKKQKDKNRLIALTKEKNAVWSYDGKTLPRHVCRYILGVYYEISLNRNQIYLEYYYHGKLLDFKTICM